MRASLIVLSLAFLPAAAFAGAKCEAHPKSEWQPENEVKAKLVAQGYQIRKFKVDGECYEIYGTDKAGKKVEIYFDPTDLKKVKEEIDE